MQCAHASACVCVCKQQGCSSSLQGCVCSVCAAHSEAAVSPCTVCESSVCTCVQCMCVCVCTQQQCRPCSCVHGMRVHACAFWGCSLAACARACTWKPEAAAAASRAVFTSVLISVCACVHTCPGASFRAAACTRNVCVCNACPPCKHHGLQTLQVCQRVRAAVCTRVWGAAVPSELCTRMHAQYTHAGTRSAHLCNAQPCNREAAGVAVRAAGRSAGGGAATEGVGGGSLCGAGGAAALGRPLAAASGRCGAVRAAGRDPPPPTSHPAPPRTRPAPGLKVPGGRH